MTCIAIQSSPNLNGLTASLAQAVLNGVEAAGESVELVHLNQLERARAKTYADIPVIGITSAGGSGRGAARALYNLEDYLRRLGFEIFDLVSVTRFSTDHKLPMLREAGRRLVASRSRNP
jgi:flavorubredoxin